MGAADDRCTVAQLLEGITPSVNCATFPLSRGGWVVVSRPSTVQPRNLSTEERQVLAAYLAAGIGPSRKAVTMGPSSGESTMS